MGHSLAPLFAGGDLPRDDPAISELFSMGFQQRSFRRAKHKTIWHVALDKGVVYDLRADPGELAPLRDPDSPTVTAAKRDVRWSRGFLDLFRQRYPRSPRISDLPLPVLQKLRSLGYAADEPGPTPVP